MDKQERPSSVSIIGWVLICFGGFTFLCLLQLGSLQDANPYDSKVILFALGSARASLLTICGVFMLMGKNWSRALFLW